MFIEDSKEKELGKRLLKQLTQEQIEEMIAELLKNKELIFSRSNKDETNSFLIEDEVFAFKVKKSTNTLVPTQEENNESPLPYPPPYITL